MTAPVRAALYLRVSTGRQAENDLSIPDQRRQAEGHCKSRGWEIVADYVEPGVSATDDRRPEFQRMIDAATTKPPAFEVIVVHSFSRFFRDQFQLEFYVRRLAKNGVRLASITQELGDDPMSNMIRQIMALFDEYQSKENAKHTLRAMKENARQGFWNGSLPPIGYRIVEAAEQHGHRTKKLLEIDPIQAETVRLIFRLAREGDGASGPMGVKSITKHLNATGVRTRDGGRWGIGAVHKVLTRTTYIGRLARRRPPALPAVRATFHTQNRRHRGRPADHRRPAPGVHAVSRADLAASARRAVSPTGCRQSRRYRRQSGKDLLVLSLTEFDPDRNHGRCLIS
jgi:site-specific DNA recombinase